MVYCSTCGTQLDSNAKFCPKCGTPVLLPRVERITIEGRRSISPLTIVLTVLVVGVVVVAVVATILLGFWLPFGQVVGSRNLVTHELNFRDYTVVEVESGFKVEITQSSSYSISITADDNLFDFIETIKRDATLTIRLKRGYSYSSTSLNAKITMPDLYQLQLSGGIHGTVKEFSSSHEFVLDLSGGSHLNLEGTASSLLITASEGSQLNLSNFFVHNANVNLSGGSRATIILDGTLDAHLSGGSQLLYIGNPVLGNINTSDGSTISKKT